MKRNTRGRSGGSILYVALTFVAVINLLALAYVKAVPTEANSFLRSQRSLIAHYVAEAGVTDAMAWITFELKNGREPTPSGPLSRTGTHDGWTWRTTITPDADSPPGGEASLRFYEVLSEAIAPNTGNVVRRIRVTMGEETFARMSNYVDVFPTSVFYHLLSGGAFIEGHVHTNTYFSMLPTAARYSSNDDPSFMGYVTSAGSASAPWDFDGVDYQQTDQAPYDAAGVAVGNRYQQLYLGGRDALNTGVNRIELPDTAMGLEVRAWGEDVPRPTGHGLHVNVDGEVKGGLFIVGDVKSMLLEAPGGNSTVTITQDDPDGNEVITKVYEGHDSSRVVDGITIGQGQTGVQVDGAGVTVYAGLPNGVIHSTGDILDLRGVNRGARLISADLATNKKIVIKGDVTRADTPIGDRPNGSRDVLGLVSYQIELSKEIPRESGNPLYLYFSYLCGKEEAYSAGGLIVEEHWDDALGRGSFYLHGSAGAGRTYATGSATSGFGYRQYFDKNVLDNPPPFFPTTGKLPIRSWREEDGML